LKYAKSATVGVSKFIHNPANSCKFPWGLKQIEYSKYIKIYQNIEVSFMVLDCQAWTYSYSYYSAVEKSSPNLMVLLMHIRHHQTMFVFPTQPFSCVEVGFAFAAISFFAIFLCFSLKT
jgi:hypothetical protein